MKIKDNLIKPLAKSLLPFVISFLGSSQAFKHSLESDPDHPCRLVGFLPKTATDVISKANVGFLYFMLLMIALEIAIFAFCFMKKSLSKTAKKPLASSGLKDLDIVQNQNRAQKGIVSDLKKFIIYFLRVVLIYCFCYLFYIIVSVALHFGCNLHNQQRNLTKPEMSMNELSNRSLQSVPSDQAEFIKQEVPRRSERILMPLSMPIIQSVVELNIAVIGMVASSDGNTVFVTTSMNIEGNTFCLSILDISNVYSPNTIGTLFINVTTSTAWDLALTSLVLSPDENTLYIGAGSTAQIINVSNLTAPAFISSVSSLEPNIGPIEVCLSTDGNTLFMQYGPPVPPTLVNMTNLDSPQFITQGNFSYPSLFNIYEDLMYVYENLPNLCIYNVSNIEDPIMVANLSIPGEIFSIKFSPNYQTFFALYRYSNLESFGIFSLSNYSILLLSNVNIGFDNFIISLDGRFLLGPGQVLDISDPTSPISFPISPIIDSEVSGYGIFTRGSQTALFTGSPPVLIQLNLDLDLQPRQFFSLQNNNYINNIVNPALDLIYDIFMSSDPNILYICEGPVGFNGNGGSINLLLFDISNPSSYSLLSSFQIPQAYNYSNINVNVIQGGTSSDGKKVFIAIGGEISGEFQAQTFTILDISGPQLVSSMLSSNGSFYSAGFAPDGNLAYAVYEAQEISQGYGLMNLIIFNTSDPSNLSVLSNISFYSVASVGYILVPATISADWKTALLSVSTTGNTFDIYDISNPSLPTRVGSFNVSGSIQSFALSDDGNIAFVLTSADIEYTNLNMVDISSPANPVAIGSLTNIPESLQLGSGFPLLFLPVTSNYEVLLINLQTSVVAVDVSTPASPRLIDYYDQLELSVMIVSPDGSFIYGITGSQILAISLQPKTLLWTGVNNISLGNTSSNYLNLFILNSENTYDAALWSYKFADVSLYTPSFDSSNNTVLPTWIEFDPYNGIITLSPASQSQMGIYSIYAGISKYIPNSTFVGVCQINNTDDSFNLLFELMGTGYIDNEGYITSNFSPDQPLITSLQYQSCASEIQQMIQSYYVEAFTIFSVISSLNLALPDPPSASSPIMISTLSSEPINVMITLNDTDSVQPKFVTQGYPFTVSFENGNTLITMVKSLLDMNSVLPQLIVFLNGSKSCAGNITITDGLNPPLNQYIPNISQYFKNSSQPYINTSFFQEQLSKVEPKTGEQFVIQFVSSSTFIDFNGEPLTLSMEMQDSSLQVPDWLEVKDFSLIGTPPDQLTGHELSMKLIVSNQYQSSEIEFTLEISISAIYLLGLIGKYGAALLSAIGLLIYAIYFYNIFGKRFYRYSKDFVVRGGEEVNSRTIYPITFASEVFTESRLIVHHLDRKIKKDIENSSKAQIAAYFCKPGSCQINRVKLVQAIEDTADNIRKGKDGNKLKKYTTIITSQKELINQLIINDFTIRLLDLAEEKSTKAAFILLKKHLFRLVDLDQRLQDGVCTFAVNKTRLNSELRIHHIKTFVPSVGKKLEKVDLSSSIRDSDGSLILESFRTPKEQNMKNKEGIEKQLVGSESTPRSRLNSMANIDLLISVIEAYAFNHHLIDANIHKIDIVAREWLDNVWPFETIRRFLKLDLNLIGLSRKAIIGYGIKYTVQEDYVFFHGTASQDIKGKTLVVQIVNLRGRILRELWIKGVDSEPETGSLSEGVL